MTQKLYDMDSMMRNFDAQVLSCMPTQDAFAVILDRTAFYPEGGGQPCDTGVLGGARVLAVHERNGAIEHIVSSPLAIGTCVHGTIDWARRFALMQNHSGEHIVSGLVNRLHGFDNVGFHMGSDAMTIDFSGELHNDALTEIERLANDAVYANLSIQTHFPSASELAAMHYRSKKELSGAVRIVCIEGIDSCACCGTHVLRTGAIGLIKILSATRYKGGSRISLLCGADAYADYARKHEDILTISRLLSAKPAETPQAVQAILDAEHNLTGQILTLRQRIVALLDAQTEVRNGIAIVFDQTLSPDDARQLCTQLGTRAKAAFVLVGTDAAGYQYVVVSADANTFASALNTRFTGRGGGKPPMAQGQITGTRAEIEAFIGQL